MTTPLWIQLEDAIPSINLTQQEKTLLKNCRAQMQNWFEALQEAIEENESLLSDCKKMHAGLLKIDAAATQIGGIAFDALPVTSYTTLRDHSSHINLMGAHHKDPDYGKPNKPRPHIDTRK
jgi:hypothetical protein